MRTVKISTYSQAGSGKINEDYILCRNLSEEYTLAILADGMGGLSYGNYASEIISHNIADYITSNLHKYEPQELLRNAFDIADISIRQKSYELKCKMGAAVCVVMIGKESIHYAWQGNVRLYKKDNGNTQLLTNDHTVNCGYTKLLIRCINGKGFREQIPVEKASKNKGDILYLCTDGYYQNSKNLEDVLLTSTSDDASMIEIIFE